VRRSVSYQRFLDRKRRTEARRAYPARLSSPPRNPPLAAALAEEILEVDFSGDALQKAEARRRRSSGSGGRFERMCQFGSGQSQKSLPLAERAATS
jgi:hypothetical protein